MAATPAAIYMVPDFLSGKIGTRLPNKKVWFGALKSDPMSNLLIEITKNNGLINLRSDLEKLYSVYLQQALLCNFSLEHGVLYKR